MSERLEEIKKRLNSTMLFTGRINGKNQIVKDIAWILEQAERVQKLEKENKRYKEAIKDFSEYGTRHDINPTTDGDVLHLMQYIQSMDRYVREKAKQALEEDK